MKTQQKVSHEMAENGKEMGQNDKQYNDYDR